MIRWIALALLTLSATTSAVGAELKIEGVLKEVNAKERTLTVERKTATGTKEVALEVAKEAGDLSSLTIGDEVSVAYDSTLEVVTKIVGTVANAGGGGQGNSKGKTVCRITLHMKEDGTSSGRVESAPDYEPEGDLGVPQSVAGGLKKVVFTFPDDESCKPFRGSLLESRDPAKYSQAHKAIVLLPTIGGVSNLTYPTRVRLPATLVADVEAEGVKSYMALCLIQNPKTLNDISPRNELQLVTEDGFKTVGVLHKHLDVGGWREEFQEKGIPLTAGCKYEVATTPPKMNLGEPWIAYCSGFSGPQKQYKGVRVRRVAITGRLAGPPLGVQMKEDGDGVFVGQVFPKTLADKAGLKVGDRVVSVSGKPASGMARTMQLLAVTELGDTWDLEVLRGNEKKTFSIKCELP
jgi:hypothetical protein